RSDVVGESPAWARPLARHHRATILAHSRGFLLAALDVTQQPSTIVTVRLNQVERPTTRAGKVALLLAYLFGAGPLAASDPVADATAMIERREFRAALDLLE